MWTAKLVSKDFNDGRLTIVVEYSKPGGVDAFKETYTVPEGVDTDWLSKRTAEKISYLVGLEGMIPVEPGQEIPQPPAPQEEPPQEDLTLQG